MSILNYFKETKAEMKHVTWPTVRQTLIYTGLVILVSITVSLLLGVSDYGFSELVKRFI